jgi:hypothetical protein
MIAALLLLLAAWSRVELVNQDFAVPPNDRWSIGDPLNQSGWVQCYYQAKPGARIRVVLLSAEDWQAWLAGSDHDEIAATALGSRGLLRQYVSERDTYIVLDNRGHEPTVVHVAVFLDVPQVRYLSRGRRFAVLTISFGIFIAIVSFSAVKLLRGVRK